MITLSTIPDCVQGSDTPLLSLFSPEPFELLLLSLIQIGSLFANPEK